MIEDVTVIPLTQEVALPHLAVVIAAGVVQAILRTNDPRLPRGARRVDGRGMSLVPALADMHVHWWDASDAALYLANGVTLVRNMAGAPLHLAWAREIDAGGFPGPRIITCSPIIDGPTSTGRPTWAGSTIIDSAAEAHRIVETFAAEGYEQLKVYTDLRPPVMGALRDAAAAVGLPVVGHCPRGMTFEKAIEAGMKCFEHLLGLERDHQVRSAGRPSANRHAPTPPCLDLGAVGRLAQMMAARDVWNCPTITVWESQLGLRRPTRDLLMYEPASILRSWARRLGGSLEATGSTQFDGQAAAQWVEALRSAVGVLHNHGAPLLAGTDTPNPLVVQGFAIHDELLNLVKAGLSPYHALRSATAEPARFVGKAGQWGTISEGSRADLLLVRGNPLVDIAALREPTCVFVNGFVLCARDLQALLDWRRRLVLLQRDEADARAHARRVRSVEAQD